MNMKHWKVDYAVVENNKVIEEAFIVVEARNISSALNRGYKHLEEIIDTENYRYVVWDVGIMEEDIL